MLEVHPEAAYLPKELNLKLLHLTQTGKIADPFLPDIIHTCPIWGAMLAGVEAASRADGAG